MAVSGFKGDGLRSHAHPQTPEEQPFVIDHLNVHIYMVAIHLNSAATILAACQMDMKSSKFIAHTLNALKL